MMMIAYLIRVREQFENTNEKANVCYLFCLVFIFSIFICFSDIRNYELYYPTDPWLAIVKNDSSFGCNYCPDVGSPIWRNAE